MNKDRPSFSSYRRHTYQRIFGKSLSKKAVVTKSGDVYAMEQPALLGWLFVIIMIIAAMIMLRLNTIVSFLSLAFIPLWYALNLLGYFFAVFYPLDEHGHMMGIAPQKKRPPFSAYAKSIFSSQPVIVKQAVEDENGVLYEHRTNNKANWFLAFIYIVMLSSWSFITVFMSVGYSIAALLCAFAVLLILSPLRYFFTTFTRMQQRTWLYKKENQPRKTVGDIIFGITLIVAAVAVFVVGMVFSFGFIKRFVHHR